MQLNERILSFGELIQTQNELNTLMAGAKWQTKMTPSHYVTQIVAEMNELLCDSGILYKWWKKSVAGDIDKWNVKIEIIDALHFALSAHILCTRAKIEVYDDMEYRAQLQKQLDKLSTEMFIGSDVMEMSNAVSLNLIKDDGWIDYEVYAQCLAESMLYIQTQGMNYLDMFRMSYAFMLMLAASVGITSPELSAVYTAKATLNRIRMSSGYKDGSYVKVDNGVEDNARLEGLVDNFLNTPDMSLKQFERVVRNHFFKPA